MTRRTQRIILMFKTRTEEITTSWEWRNTEPEPARDRNQKSNQAGIKARQPYWERTNSQHNMDNWRKTLGQSPGKPVPTRKCKENWVQKKRHDKQNLMIRRLPTQTTNLAKQNIQEYWEASQHNSQLRVVRWSLSLVENSRVQPQSPSTERGRMHGRHRHKDRQGWKLSINNKTSTLKRSTHV